MEKGKRVKRSKVIINIIVNQLIKKDKEEDNMPRSKVRGGRKAHNKRIRHRRLMANHQVLAVEALKRKIYEEAKERYIKEQQGTKLNVDEEPSIRL